jgi:putative endonuclease
LTAGAAHLAAGRAAEDAACAELARQGFSLLFRNYRTRRGEIDIVALEGEVLAIVEVRYRARSDYGSAAESVTWRKQSRWARAARELLAREPDLARLPARFDLVEVEDGAGDELRCRLTRAAFSL